MADELHGVALLGAGIFAKTAHLPAIANADTLRLVAVYSRSLSSARDLVSEAAHHPTVPSPLPVYSEDGHADSAGSLDDLLARSDVQTVALALPIMLQPEIIERAWKAGKNVISEKPIAPDVASAHRLIELYEREYQPKGITWIIAEQFPYEASYNKARDIIAAGKIGQVHSFALDFFNYVVPDSKYHATTWRNKPDYQGGFLLDGGVHFVAGLRHMLPHPITAVTATRSLHHEHLPPFDTLTGSFTTSDPLLAGTFQISFGIAGCSTKMYTLRGTKGTLTVNFGVSPQILTLTTLSTDPNESEPHELVIELPQGEGVLREFEAFGEALTEGQDSESWSMVQQRSGPRATLRDLAIIEAALASGATDGKQQVDLKELSGIYWDL